MSLANMRLIENQAYTNIPFERHQLQLAPEYPTTTKKKNNAGCAYRDEEKAV